VSLLSPRGLIEELIEELIQIESPLGERGDSQQEVSFF
jgi:hypothetical protein